jgi:phosphohistidine phosphatase
LILYLVRHADAETKKPGASDFDRELTEIGRETSKKMALALKKIGVKVDLIISSPLIRAVQTAEIFRDIMGIESEILKLNELIPGSDFQFLIGVISHLNKESILAVGHEPHLGDFLAWFICLPKRIDFKKNSIACVEVESFTTCGGNLKWLIHPEQILNLL